MNAGVSYEPLLFIIDLDGTIIGDCTYQVCAYNVEKTLKKHKQKCSSESLRDSYGCSAMLVRPFFKTFYQTMKRFYPNSLFYIYTASEKEWANKEISLIEKSHDIKFNRPIFSRKDCMVDADRQFVKSVEHILPAIRRKNKNLKIKESNTIVIDNNRVFTDYTDNFILCPTYDYVSFIDMWRLIKKEHLRVPEIRAMVYEVIASKKMCKHNDMLQKNGNSDKIAEMMHKWMYKKQKKINENNAKYANDTFWRSLTSMIVANRSSINGATVFNKKIDLG